MENNDQGKAEGTFKNFGKKVDEFMAELSVAGDKLQKEFNAKYDELKVSAEKLKNESENKERWKEVEESLKKAGEELSKAFKAAFKKRESEPGEQEK
jgi:phosphoglycerate-specific signal transduction histidine kinase